ncbi:Gfo/Idh/MocA family protein [Paludibaculum fermentans]|uniref:Gfo/Idh/MocA family oxidoreductase n=1 Tax=Paludibaculum fermentans TaxID=1473598 RepID=A0A7S7NPB5_PALFE|nr:Gfo/Idh/MocA family oxidoreductase [Paludibaculum fermentans]QOY87290.1 Gfo/Idh/MocA family oxidoreductase [Paludibaculum fermentans]
MSNTVTRRGFVAAAVAALPSTALSYSRIPGANDRIQIGAIGCGHRASGHRKMLKKSLATDPKFDFRSVCDLWSVNRERAADSAKQLFGARPKTYKYSEEMLADPELDAVMIGTGDHQHARILAEVVRAGKDCYCEKPMANTLEDAMLAREAVLSSKRVVQMGSQWLSDPYQQQVRDIVRSGKLGKIVSVDQSWNFSGPRWHVPKNPDVAALKEQDTDWKRWLLGRPDRPFDPRVYFEFRIFKDFSGGITDQWYSHGSGLAHFYLDTFIPDDTMANGGIFAWHDVRENPDTLQMASTFKEKQVLYTYSTTFGSSYGDHTIIRGTRGSLYSPGGEGSPQWWYIEENRSAWGSNVVFDLHNGKAKPQLVTIPGSTDTPPVDQDDDLKYHTDNWLQCMRSRKTPNGSIETGFAHAVAVVMANRSYREGRKMYWDRKNEKILDHPPAA